jgi:hypothetical protein
MGLEFENQVGWVVFKIGDRSHEGDQFFLDFLSGPLQGLFIVLFLKDAEMAVLKSNNSRFSRLFID